MIRKQPLNCNSFVVHIIRKLNPLLTVKSPPLKLPLLAILQVKKDVTEVAF